MTELQRAINYLRFGEYGDYVESEDGSVRITRLSNHLDTLPTCHIRRNKEYWETNAFYGEVVLILEEITQ